MTQCFINALQTTGKGRAVKPNLKGRVNGGQHDVHTRHWIRLRDVSIRQPIVYKLYKECKGSPSKSRVFAQAQSRTLGELDVLSS